MSDFVRPSIRSLAGYTPGEQPRDGDYIKLNTNENPYPPSPRVFEAIQQALTADRLRKYPDPLGAVFRQVAGRVLGVSPESILIGNGSDDVLTIITRALVPEGGLVVSPAPSYLLYKTLAEIQGARHETIPYTPAWELDTATDVSSANVLFVANPNSPSGTVLSVKNLLAWRANACHGQRVPLVIDEAYVDFAESNCLSLATSHEAIIVTRSLSKSYSLAGIRFGFAVAGPALVEQLYKVKDSYNCDVLSLIAATAALEDQEHMRANRARILATRTRMTALLRGLGFEVCESQANFVWCRRFDRPVKPIYEALKIRKILVRYMHYQGYGDGLRITVGTDEEIDRLLEATAAVM